MIDPLVSLAFSLHSCKGAYALLVGSGISRAAEIPTGWELENDLIRKMAAASSQNCEPEPRSWYQSNYGENPNYSKLLDALARSSTERQQLLKPYFEPTPEQRERGIKMPTKAHRAIAELIAGGYVRVVVTTNFDRLLEHACEDVGVSPTVISTPDQISGAIPLVHSGVTIIKLHGDYLDTRIKNTELELEKYEVETDQLLDRIFDEFGVVVCGWSAEFDSALRAAIERCPSRRFTTFWTSRGPLKGSALVVANHRKAQLIQVKDADELFCSLSEKVKSLEALNTPHPLSTKMMVAALKRYLPEQRERIRLHDLVYAETERAATNLSNETFPMAVKGQPVEEIAARVPRYEAIAEPLLWLMGAGVFWGTEEQVHLWCDSVERIALTATIENGSTYLNNLKRYPALLMLYAGGVAAALSDNWSNLSRLLYRPRAITEEAKFAPACSVLNPVSVMEKGRWFGTPQSRTPISDRIWNALRDPLREFAPDEDRYNNAFDTFEYLLGWCYADIVQFKHRVGWWGPIGRFRYRFGHLTDFSPSKLFGEEISNHGPQSKILKHGLFGGSVDRAKTAKSNFDAFLGSFHEFH